MSDKIIEELWQIKDSIAQEHGYNIEALVTHLQTKKRPEDQQVVDLHALKETAGQDASEEHGRLS